MFNKINSKWITDISIYITFRKKNRRKSLRFRVSQKLLELAQLIEGKPDN